MITYLIHTALMLLGAFLAGLILGKLIKWLFCRNKKNAVVPQDDYDAPAVLVPAAAEYDKRPARLGMTGDAQDMVEPEVRKSRLSMAGTGTAAAVAATGTAAAGAKYAIDRLKADQSDVADLPKAKKSSFQASFPKARTPVVDVEIPEVELPAVAAPVIPVIEAPSVDLPSAHIDSELPRIAGLELSDFSMKTPTVDVDATNIELPDVDAELSDTDFPIVELPLAELPEVDVNLPVVSEPKVDLSGIKPPEITLPEITAPELDLPAAELPETNLRSPEITAPDIDLPEADVDLPELKTSGVDVNIPEVNVDLPDVDLKKNGLELGGALKGAALAAGAGIATKVSGGFDAKAPEVDLPGAELPQLDLPEVELPEVDLPEVDMPNMDVSAPSLDVDQPELKAPNVDVNIPEVNVDLAEVKTPDIDLPEKASGFGSALKGAALAAGAGVVAKASGLGEKVEDKLDTANVDVSADTLLAVEEATTASEGSILMQHLRSAKVKPNIKLPLVTDDGVIVNEPADSADASAVNDTTTDLSAGIGAAESQLTTTSSVNDAAETAALNVSTETVSAETEVPVARSKPVTLDASELAPIIAAAAGAGVTHRLDTTDSTGIDGSSSAASTAAGDGVTTTTQTVGNSNAAYTDADMSGLFAKIRQQMQAHNNGGANRSRVVTLDDVCQNCAGLSSLSAGGIEALVLRAGEYDKMDTIHCGVTRSGFVAVGGDVSTISDNQVVLFMMHNVAVCRNDNTHTFVVMPAN